MGLLLTTKVIDYRHSYITELEDKGLITNPEQTVFQLIAEYHYTNNTNISYNITKKILESLIAEQYGISYMIGNETIYNRSIERFNNSRFALTSRKIAFLSVNQSIFFGPEIAELKIWS